MNSYVSFLVCDHREQGGEINVYANGLPLGVIKGAVFIQDPLFKQRWGETVHLAKYLTSIAETIRQSIPPPPPPPDVPK